MENHLRQYLCFLPFSGLLLASVIVTKAWNTLNFSEGQSVWLLPTIWLSSMIMRIVFIMMRSGMQPHRTAGSTSVKSAPSQNSAKVLICSSKVMITMLMAILECLSEWQLFISAGALDWGEPQHLGLSRQQHQSQMQVSHQSKYTVEKSQNTQWRKVPLVTPEKPQSNIQDKK